MTDNQKSRLTQSFLGLPDEAFSAVPPLQRALAEAINSHLDAKPAIMGTVMTALAITVGEYLLATGKESDAMKKFFLEILDAYMSTGTDGAIIGPDSEPSLVRRFRAWPWSNAGKS